MAKQSGLDARFYVAGYDLSGDTAAINTLSGGHEVQETPDLAHTAMSRLALTRDGEMEVSSYFDTASDAEHAALKSVPTTNCLATVTFGTAQGNPAANVWGKRVTYDLDRGDDGSLGVSASVVADGYGLDWGVLLTAGKATVTPGNGAGLDMTTVSTAYGAAAYLQVFSVTAGTVTIHVEDSANGVDFVDVTGLSFTAASAQTAGERVATATDATIRQHARYVVAGGTAVVAVSLCRYLAPQA